MQFNVLIVDDEPDLLEFLRYNLVREGYSVTTAADGLEALEEAQSGRFHMILLDVRLPGMDGFDVCKRIRGTEAIAETPIIMLTAMSDEQNEVAGLDAGADDYLEKPISPRLLLSRIEATLRRVHPEAAVSSVLQRDDLEIDRQKYVVRRIASGKGSKYHLPRKQFELLYSLAAEPGVVLSREELLDKIWGKDVYVSPRTVDVHVRKIRDKIGERYIETVKGVGYRFREKG